MNNQLTVMSQCEENYNKALVDSQTHKKIGFVTIPLNLLILAPLFFLEGRMFEHFAFGGSLFGIFNLITAIQSIKPSKDHYFPAFKLEELVYYNPQHSEGKRRHEISREHAVLNQHIPVWTVVSVGSSSLVVQKKESDHLMEVKFSEQGDLFPAQELQALNQLSVVKVIAKV